MWGYAYAYEYECESGICFTVRKKKKTCPKTFLGKPKTLIKQSGSSCIQLSWHWWPNREISIINGLRSFCREQASACSVLPTSPLALAILDFNLDRNRSLPDLISYSLLRTRHSLRLKKALLSIFLGDGTWKMDWSASFLPHTSLKTVGNWGMSHHVHISFH